MMVSSKFSVKPPPFKVPAVCKKKRPPGGEPPGGEPLPGDVVNGHWWIHGWYAGVRVDREGMLPMPKINPMLYYSTWPAPPDGEFIWMNWNPATYAWSGTLYLYEGINLKYVFNSGIHIYTPNANFDTGRFNWNVINFVGQQQGRYANPL